MAESTAAAIAAWLAKLRGQTIYADTNIFIYALGRHTVWGERCAALLQAAAQRELQLIAGELVLAELLVGPLREQNPQETAAVRRLMEHSGLVRLVAHPKPSLELAASLRASHRLKIVDAIHVAAAIHHRADSLLTHDRGIGSLPGIAVIGLS